MAALKGRFPGLELHLIGPLQTNKVEDAVALFDVIQTVDRPRLAAALAREMAKQKKSPKLLAQVNTGLEPQKAGVAPDQVAGFLAACAREHGLRFAGSCAFPRSIRTRRRTSACWPISPGRTALPNSPWHEFGLCRGDRRGRHRRAGGIRHLRGAAAACPGTGLMPPRSRGCEIMLSFASQSLVLPRDLRTRKSG